MSSSLSPNRDTTRVHASCISLDSRAVLLFGPSGAGKSDLSVWLIDEGATLVSDDYTDLSLRRGALIANAPSNIWGQVEVRGLGIMRMTPQDDVPVSLVIDLGPPPERLPEARTRSFLGIAIPVVTIDPRSPSAAAKVRLALDVVALPPQ